MENLERCIERLPEKLVVHRKESPSVKTLSVLLYKINSITSSLKDTTHLTAVL